ncbi:MAG: class I SAM-dependent RNA methyltransferase, partial [Betaproteobacteria bacterium]
MLWRVGQFEYGNEDHLYAAVRAIDWPNYFRVERTLRVNVTAQKSPLKSLEFATLRIKDAVCDRFRDASSRRPDVERSNPDIRVHAFLEGARGTLYLDTSGEPLFKRGWRAAQAEAP